MEKKVAKNCIGKKLNVPFESNRKFKKKQVCVKDKEGNVVNPHFGDKRYRHNYSKEAREKYIKRSAGITDKEGNLTKNDKTSANYWARKILWEDKWD